MALVINKIYVGEQVPHTAIKGDLWNRRFSDRAGVMLEHTGKGWKPWEEETFRMGRSYLEEIDTLHVTEKQLVEVISNYRELGYMVAVEPNRDRVNNGLTGITTYTTSYKITVYRKEVEANE